MVERFREKKRYPTPEHEEQKRLREEWVEKLRRRTSSHSVVAT